MLRPDGEGIEYLEPVLEAFGFLTYCGAGISPGMWAMFEPMCYAFHHFAYDYIKEMACSLDNFVTRATDQFCAGCVPRTPRSNACRQPNCEYCAQQGPAHFPLLYFGCIKQARQQTRQLFFNSDVLSTCL